MTARYPAPMAGIPLDRVPNSARTAWLALRDELQHILGDELVAMWAYGGTMAVDDPAHAGDLDTYVVISRRPDEATDRSDRGRAGRDREPPRRRMGFVVRAGSMRRAARIRRTTPGATSGATPHGQ